MSEYNFSTIIITHTAELEIQRTIESVINQTLNFEDNIEIVIVDFGNGDTERLCKDYFDRYPNNFKYISKENITDNTFFLNTHLISFCQQCQHLFSGVPTDTSIGDAFTINFWLILRQIEIK